MEMGERFGRECCLALIKENLVFALGNKYYNPRSIEMLDLSLESLQWKSTVDMLVHQSFYGVGVLDDRYYAVGGYNNRFSLKSVECYDPSFEIWTSVTLMSTNRRSPSIGVLDGVMYAIGGGCQKHVSSVTLKSVEAYTSINNVWSHIADMHLCQYNPNCIFNIGVLTLNSMLADLMDLFIWTLLKYDPKTNTWTMKPLPISVEVIIGAVVFDMPLHLRTY